MYESPDVRDVEAVAVFTFASDAVHEPVMRAELVAALEQVATRLGFDVQVSGGREAGLARRLREAERAGDDGAVLELENEIVALLGLAHDETEQGLSVAAGCAVDAFRDRWDPAPGGCGDFDSSGGE